MVQELNRSQQQPIDFPETASTAYPVFYRTYSRRIDGERESWQQTTDRTLRGLAKLGKLSDKETELIDRMQKRMIALPSGRWLWVGGTEWLENPQNFSGAYNCTSTNVIDWKAFGLMMDLAMMGCGTGGVLEPHYISQLPPVRNAIHVTVTGELGSVPAADRLQETTVDILGNAVRVVVGDSRQGWVKSYQTLLDLCSDDRFEGTVNITIDLSNVRPAGEALQGFGGVANPIKLPALYDRVAKILNRAIGRQLTSVECCLLIDEAAVTIVAGNIRRCLPGESLVHTAAGLVPIQKIRVGDRVLTSKGFYPVTNFFAQGQQTLCRIHTQDGSLECTADHKVAVLDDVHGNYRMVKARDLQPGDRLIFVPQSIPGTPTELPEFRETVTGKTKAITVPALTPDVAYFLGYLQGNGSVASDGSRVRFLVHEDSPQILDRLQAVGREFGLNTFTLRSPGQCRTKAYELQFNSSALNRYLGKFKKAFQALNVPDAILLGTPEIRWGYLAGLADANGCHSQGVLIASIHPRFLQQVQALYASLGVTVRLRSSTQKRAGQWEGELVTVGEQAFNAVESAFTTYSLQFATQKRDRPQSFKDHGFPKSMVRPLVNTYQYPWGKAQQQMTLPTLKRHLPQATELVPVAVRHVELGVRVAETFDIEVATVHEFVCEGLLVSNSAGMRQFNSNDELGAKAKDNLWQQDEAGNWRIDPDRDALRMANHTRVFHQKPTETECIEAVRKQFYSGEGAIQWAGEAIARSNADLISGIDEKKAFIAAFQDQKGAAWLKTKAPQMDERESAHRLQRYGLNPCVTADTWVHTEFGPRQVKELIGQQHGTYVNGELFSTTTEGFFYTGNKPVFKVTTREGLSLRLTANHQLLRVSAQTQKCQYLEWTAVEDLQPGDRLSIHNHRDIQPWSGNGTFDEGWLLGSLVGDGSLAETNWSDQGILRFGGDSQQEMAEYAVATLQKTVACGAKLAGCYHPHHHLHQIASSGLAALADRFGIHRREKWVTDEIERSSYEFYCGFLRGLFDADGSVQGTQQQGISVRLAQSNLATLEAVQRMLLRVGIASTIYQNRRPAGVRLMPDSDRNLAPYFCQAQHELVIANDNLTEFRDRVGFQQPAKQAKLNELLNNYKRKLNRDRFSVTISEIVPDGIEPVYDCTVPGPARFDANGFVAHNCGEILGADFHCNLSEVHLNQIDPQDYKTQEDAFKAGALSVASLLNHRFQEERYQYSRSVDPIVGVSFTGLFDFFVQAFGVDWLRWWEAGRPDTVQGLEFKGQERQYLSRWREIVHQTVWDYCDRQGLRRPNRCTTVQPAGCLDRTALRIFDQGLLYADEIVAPGSGETVGLDLTVRGGLAADTAIANQPLNLVRVTLANGRVLRMTPNHRLSIAGQWVRADELHVGMEIDHSLGEYAKAEDALLLPLDLHSYDREGRKEIIGHGRGVLTSTISTPATLNPELGYFLGCLYGDGAISEHQYRIRFAFNSQEYDLVERLQQIAERWFGLTGTVNIDPRNNSSRGELVFATKQLFDWFKLNGLAKSASTDLDRIPQAIRRSSRETILAFFCGLIDTDGCIRERGSLSIDSASEAFIRNLQQVGEAVGLSFSIFHNNQGSNFQATKDMWGLCLSRMASQPAALDYLNAHSRKCALRPLPSPKRHFAFHPYAVAAIEFETSPDYSYDFAVAGVDDDDSWYWQGGLKSHNTKSLLTGASPGWHPPKAARFIRRITFRKNDPVARACLDYGYSVVPSQSDKDENGRLLDDPFDPRCTEWLVEIPVAVPWADLPGADTIAIERFSALAQFDFYMQVQTHYTTHNTSATIELRESEIEPLGQRIYQAIQNDEGYISAALLARFDDLQTFPRLPFEPISRETYQEMHDAVLERRRISSFHEALRRYDLGEMAEAGPAGCDSDKCLLPETKS
jgi:intein/homing endonuclease